VLHYNRLEVLVQGLTPADAIAAQSSTSSSSNAAFYSLEEVQQMDPKQIR
jgi:hypothetical protein